MSDVLSGAALIAEMEYHEDCDSSVGMPKCSENWPTDPKSWCVGCIVSAARRALVQAQEAQGGAWLIAAERARQVSVEGYSPAHDDAHAEEELVIAALFFIDAGTVCDLGFHAALPPLPADWKCRPRSRILQTHDERLRHLVKAGALLAAEIDRLQRGAALSAPAPTDKGTL
jgi:hypothetical protein